ncbi:hypothetical protein LINPERPRIM_LOCUS5047 [Linum perenne]
MKPSTSNHFPIVMTIVVNWQNPILFLSCLCSRHGFINARRDVEVANELHRWTEFDLCQRRAT